MTCQIKLNPGPVKSMDPVAAQRIKKARINRVRCFKTGFMDSPFYFDSLERVALVPWLS